VKVTRREIVLTLATLTVALFGGSLVLVKPRIQAWKDLQAQQNELRRQIEVDSRMVAQRAQWAAKFAELSQVLPRHPADKEVDVYWLSILNDAAKKQGVELRRIEADKEKPQGDVFELPIECKEWAGTLPALVRFLFDLQTQGAMLDIRHLLIKPRGKGVLGGRFTLYCAYMREGQPKAAAGGAAKKK
jgi:Tfp pilus assembly protein PilO